MTFMTEGLLEKHAVLAASEHSEQQLLASVAISLARMSKPEPYASITEPYRAAIRMIRDAIEELFGPTASLESEDAVLLRGPEPHHDAEAIIAALQRIQLGVIREKTI